MYAVYFIGQLAKIHISHAWHCIFGRNWWCSFHWTIRKLPLWRMYIAHGIGQLANFVHYLCMMFIWFDNWRTSSSSIGKSNTVIYSLTPIKHNHSGYLLRNSVELSNEHKLWSPLLKTFEYGFGRNVQIFTFIALSVTRNGQRREDWRKYLTHTESRVALSVKGPHNF